MDMQFYRIGLLTILCIFLLIYLWIWGCWFIREYRLKKPYIIQDELSYHLNVEKKGKF